MTDSKEMYRIVLNNLNLKDSAGNNIGIESLKDWDNIVKQFTKSLESATNSIVNVVTKINAKGQAVTSFDIPFEQANNATVAFKRTQAEIETLRDYEPYSLDYTTKRMREISFTKNFYGSKSKQELKKIMQDLGGSAESDPSKMQPDRMKVFFPVSEQEYINTLTHYNMDSSKAKKYLSNRFTKDYLGSAVKYSNDVRDKNKETQEKKEKEREEKQSEQSKLRKLGKIALVAQILAKVFDIVKRILSATLARASEVNQEHLTAKNLGVTQRDVREYRNTEIALGMKEGAITGGIGSLQGHFGDITHLDENALSELAKVLQGDVIHAINQGLGKDDPEHLMEIILDTYFKRGQQGINSIGQYVGKANAERELATALEKAGLPEIADILRSMYYANDEGIHKGMITDFQSFNSLTSSYTNGLDGIDNKVTRDLGQTINELKARFDDLKKNLEEGLLLALAGVITKINAWDIGKSATEKLEASMSNKDKLKLARQQNESKAKSLQDAYTQSLESAGFTTEDWEALGATSAVDFFENLDTSDLVDGNKYANNPVYQKLRKYLRSKEGATTFSLLSISQAYADQAEANQMAYNKGLRTGKFEYDAIANTNEGVLSLAKKDLEAYVWRNPSGSAVFKGRNSATSYILNDSAGLTYADKKQYYPEDVYDYYVREFLDGDFSYEKLVDYVSDKSNKATGLDSELTKQIYLSVYGKLPWNYTTKKGEKGVLKALSEGLITNSDIEDVMRRNADKGGYGIPSKTQTAISKALQEQGESLFLDRGSSYFAVTEALATEKAQKALQEATAKNLSASTAYNKASGKLDIVISSVDEKGNKKVIYTTDADAVMSNTDNTFTFDLSQNVDALQTRGEGQ